jgi:tetratricopeptide (TPR) repeat protein
VGTTWQAIRANVEAERAQTEAAISKAVNEFLNEDLLAQADPENEPDRDIKLRTVLDRASERIEGRFANQPLVEAAIRDTLGRTYLSLGEYGKAEQDHQRSRELRQRVLGAEHPATLSSMDNLAGATLRQGQYAEAEKLYREVLELRQRVLGPEDLATLSSKHNLANAIALQREYAQAERLYREVLEMRRRVLEPGHPQVLSNINNLANVIALQGRYDEVVKLHRDVLQTRRRVLGPEHPHTLASMNNVALAIEKQGQHAEAEELYREVLEIQQRVLGPEHPEVLSSMNNLAVAIARQGQFAEAEKVHRELLEIKRRVLGPEHPGTLSSMNNVAVSLGLQRQYTQAEELYREVLETCQRVLGPEHPATLESLRRLVTAYTTWCWCLATAADPAERNAEEALEFARKTVELKPDIANHWNNLGVAFLRNDDYQAAIEALQKADAMLESGDRAHRMFLAMAYWNVGDKEKARELYAQGAAWIAERRRNDEELSRFRDETEQLMGIGEEDRKRLIEEYHARGGDEATEPTEQNPNEERIDSADSG